MSQRKRFSSQLGWAAGILCILLTTTGTARAEPPKEVVLGVAQALTGPAAAWGQSCWNGIQLATEIVNEQGGIKSLGGAKLKAVIYDTETKPDIAQAQTEKAIDQGAVILTGSTQSAAAMLATTVAERYKVPFIFQDNDQMVIERGYKYTFKIRPHARVYAETILQFIQQMGKEKGIKIDKVAMLCENNGVGQGFMKAAQSVFATKPEYRVIDASLYDASTADFSGYIAKHKAGNVQILIGHFSPNPAVLVTRAMKQLKFQPLGFFGMAGGQITVQYVDALGQDANGVFSTMDFCPALKIGGLAAVMKRYKDKFNMNIDDTSVMGFSVTAVAWDALERAASRDPKIIRDKLADMDLKTPERNYFYITGSKFDQQGQNIAAIPTVTQIRNKAWIPVWPEKYATDKAIFPMWGADASPPRK
jgi:branched-chain amino acid transport system substrate-binding protein